jgi:hypothetical protein
VPPDPRDFAEPIDIVAKLPSSLSSNITSSKWKERKEVLDDLLALLNSTPRIKEASEFGEIARALAARIHTDANINCVMAAAGCMEALAKGLRTAFGRYREMVVSPMLERLKERKATVTDAIGAALDAVFMTVSHLAAMEIHHSPLSRPPYRILSLISYLRFRRRIPRSKKALSNSLVAVSQLLQHPFNLAN